MSATPPIPSLSPDSESPANAQIKRAAPGCKANGVYYTPPRLAGLLAEWTLERQPNRILEPSYGNGVFLRAAAERLATQGIREPGPRLFGVELDPKGPERLREAGLSLAEDQLHCADLLALDVDALGGEFDAILGNPPYIRHHLLPPELVRRGRESASLIGIELNGRSDAWAYFCAHLVTFLAPRGRLALVLPGSVLHADYASPLLDALAREEGEVQLIRVRERLFPGVQERTVLLLIDRAAPNGKPVRYRSIADLKGLKRALGPGRHRRRNGAGSLRRRDDPRLPWRLKATEARIWEEVRDSNAVAELGALTKIRIGVVTGANSFFIRSSSGASALGESIDSVPIISRGGWLKGPRWDHQAQAEMAAQPSRLMLFPASEARLGPKAKAEVRRGEQEGLDRRSHCVRRSPWYSIADRAASELLLPYMAARPPRIVLNEAMATCTNTVHRIWLYPDAGTTPEAVAAGSWTTLYRLSAELFGRSYGGGVLKLEPGGATALRIVLTPDPTLFGELTEAYDAGGVEAARLLADRRLLIDGVGMTKKEISTLAVAATRLADLRRR